MTSSVAGPRRHETTSTHQTAFSGIGMTSSVAGSRRREATKKTTLFFFVPSCLRAFVPSCLRAFVPSCLRAFVPSWQLMPLFIRLPLKAVTSFFFVASCCVFRGH
jgi:hypothetical protein